MNQSKPLTDPLATARPVPDIAALYEAARAAQHHSLCNLESIAEAEAERYQTRAGKDGSGQLWQRNLPQGQVVKPYDGCPDPDASLTDEMCENEVDLDLTARAMGVLGTSSSHLSPLTAAQSSELLAVARYVERALEEDLAEHEELLAQMKATNGLAVLNPGWCERWELVQRELDLESFIVSAAELIGPDGARQLYTAILDPGLDELAEAAVQKLFAHLPAARVKQIVQDLRHHGAAQFLDRQLAEKRPTIRTLIPGYNYFVSGSASTLKEAYLHLVIERFYPARFQAVAAENGWNEAFVQRALATEGQYSTLGEGMRNKEQEAELATEDRSIELWTTHVLQFDPETGAAGIYCTTFSPHVLPAREDTGPEHYAAHYLLDYAHRTPPFVLARREVNGPGVFDSRSVPDITRSNNNVIRNLQKAGLARAHLETDPPRALLGTGWKTGGGSVNTPGRVIESLMPGGDVKDLSPAAGSPQVGEAAIERVERATHRLFAFPDNEVHPARWQPRAMRKSRRALEPFRQAYTQLVVLCYQNFEPQELAQIIGHWPQLNLQDVLHHRITITFDPRGLDNDWRAETLQTFISLLGVDRGGTFDTNRLIQIIGNLTDPSLISSVTQDSAGASAKLYRKVQQDINDIMLGNPPPMVEMDASAGMQLKMAFQILGQNRRYQQLLQQDRLVANNFKLYMENLQHSEQETQISPVQGRLGVAQMPQRPVQTGPTALE